MSSQLLENIIEGYKKGQEIPWRLKILVFFFKPYFTMDYDKIPVHFGILLVKNKTKNLLTREQNGDMNMKTIAQNCVSLALQFLPLNR